MLAVTRLLLHKTINVDDNTAPVITGTIAPVTIEGCTTADAPAPLTTVAALETAGLTITDACTADANLVVTSSQTSTGTCPLVITRTYVITDACGNSATATQTINVDDNTAPVITGTIAPVTIEGCTTADAPAALTTVAALETAGLTITDACTADANLVVTSSQTSTGTCPLVITRTYVITDACGNSATATQTINVDDNTAPVITGTIAPVTIEGCTTADAPAALTTVAALETAGLTITDACTADANLVVTSSQTSTGTCPLVITRTYVITDACGNSATATQTINVDDNTAPVITGTIAPVTIEGCTTADAPAALTTVAALETAGLTITDACTADNALTVSSSQTSTGTCPLVITRTYVITDACGNSASVNHTINIDDNTAPVITGTMTPVTVEGCTTADAPAALTTVAALEALGVTITDACTPDASLTVSSSQTSTGTCPLVITRTYVITDACGNSASVNHTINIDDNTAPVITGTMTPVTVEGCTTADAPAALTTVAALEALGITITDACTPDASLTVSSSQTSTGTCPLVITRTYVITDACGNSASVNHTINIDDNTAPVITGTMTPVTVEGCTTADAPAALTTVAALEALGITITDACTADANLVVTSSQTSTGTCPLVITRTYVITDACGNSASVNHTINIDDNTAPVITGTMTPVTVEGCTTADAPAALTTVAALEALGITITDACTPDASLTVSSSQTSTGTCPLVITRTYVITDACGNSASVNHTINIDDNTAPVITGTMTPVTVEGCTTADAPAALTTVAALEALGITITDACTADANLVVTSSQTSTGTCPLVITRTYVITDACGNSASVNHTINIDDNTAPVITGTMTPVTVEGCTTADAPAALTTVAALEALGITITDACTPDASLTVSSSQTSTGTCPLVITRTYVITDACGNSASVNHTINIDDNTAPVITGTMTPVTVEGCTTADAPAALTTVAALEALGITITDACTADANLVVTSSQTSTGTCPLVITRTYVITDACGNSASVNHTINIDDNTAPVITGTMTPVTVEGCTTADAPAALTTVAALEALGITITDACTADANLVVTSSQTSTGTCPLVITRTYVITDACGNSASVNHTINIDDNTAPVITGTMTPVTVEGCTTADAPAALTTVAALEALGITITDACTADANLVVTSSQTSTGTCPLVITRTYVITDACGNSASVNHTINIDDNTAPVITGTMTPVTVEGCTTADAPAALTTVAALEALGITITDACTPDASLTCIEQSNFYRHLSTCYYKNLCDHRCMR
jgi:hypothetical protein